VIYEALDYNGFVEKPELVIRYAGREWGYSGRAARRPYDLLDMMTVKLGIAEETREEWLRVHGSDVWEVEATEWHPRPWPGDNVNRNTINGSTDYGRRRDIFERIREAYGRVLKRAAAGEEGPTGHRAEGLEVLPCHTGPVWF
jgi:hypothetical protein